MKHTEFETAFLQMLGNKTSFPNLKEIKEPQEALKLLGSMASEVHGTYDLKVGEGWENRLWYPKVFVHKDGMNHAFDGSGAILSSDGRVFQFQMCQHDWNTSGANHSRGWHPRVCKKCGFDASIDSGD